MSSVLLFAFSSFSFAADLNDVVKKVELRYKDVSSLKASFVQVTNNPAFPEPIQQTGTLSMLKPHNLRWDFEGAQSYIHNGEKIWMWNPILNQVVITKSQGNGDQLTSLLTDLSKLEKQYGIILKEESTDAFHLEITPKEQNQAFDKLNLFIQKETFVLNKLSYSAENTGSVEISFSDLQFNAPFDSKLFTFVPPKDAEVIEIDE